MPPSTHGKQRRPNALAAFVFLSHIVLCSMVTRIAPICLQNTASNKDIIDQVDILDAFDAYANVGHSCGVKPSRADAWRRIWYMFQLPSFSA